MSDSPVPHLTDFVDSENSRDFTKPHSCEENDKIEPKIEENLLVTMSRRYTDRIVGERENIQLLICAVVSRSLPNDCRISVLLLNRYGSGKSHLLNTILEPIDDSGDVLHFTQFTEAYLKRSHELADVNGKILKIEQLERKDENGQIFISNLKHLITEGRLTFGVVDRDEKGKQNAGKLDVRGKPVILTTSTNPNINPEDESRFIIVELDESDEQTKQILMHKAKLVSKINPHSLWGNSKSKLNSDFEELKRVARHVEQIVVPFWDKVVENISINLQLRRDLDKLLRITQVIAFINYKNRVHLIKKTPEKLLNDNFGGTQDFYKSIIIASVEDFTKAVEIAGKAISQTINSTTQKTMNIVNAVKSLSMGSLDGVTLNNLEEMLQIPRNTIRDHLKIAENNGFVLRNTESKDHRWTPTEKKHLGIETNIEFSDSELKKWLDENCTDSYQIETSYLNKKQLCIVPEKLQNSSRSEFREDS